MTYNSDKEMHQGCIRFKTGDDFCEEIVDMRCKNVVLLELLEKSIESKGRLKERTSELEKMLQVKEEEFKNKII